MVGFCTADVKPFGPVQVYVPVVAVVVARLIGLPTHTGELDEAVGVAGTAFTVTVYVAAGDVQPLWVYVTEYVPLLVAEAEAMVGFCAADVNPFGPVQAYVPGPLPEAVRLMGDPAHTGEFPPAVGAAGAGLITTFCTVAADVQPAAVSTNE